MIQNTDHLIHIIKHKKLQLRNFAVAIHNSESLACIARYHEFFSINYNKKFDSDEK